jgi:hypothetical protein
LLPAAWLHHNQNIDQQAEPENQIAPVALRYEDAAQYQGVFKPLVKLEADYDKVGAGWVGGVCS